MAEKRAYIRKQVVLMILCLFAAVLVSENVRAEELGSITIETKEPGLSFMYTKVAEIVDGAYEGEYIKDLQLNSLSDAEELQKTAKILEERVKKSDGTVTADEEGTAVIENLEMGLYLVTAKKTEPSLVSVPLWDLEAKEMRYDVKVIPKYGEDSEKPTAPQTNLDSNYKERIITAGVCMLVAVVFLYAVRGKDDHESSV